MKQEISQFCVSFFHSKLGFVCFHNWYWASFKESFLSLLPVSRNQLQLGYGQQGISCNPVPKCLNWLSVTTFCGQLFVGQLYMVTTLHGSSPPHSELHKGLELWWRLCVAVGGDLTAWQQAVSHGMLGQVVRTARVLVPAVHIILAGGGEGTGVAALVVAPGEGEGRQQWWDKSN